MIGGEDEGGEEGEGDEDEQLLRLLVGRRGIRNRRLRRAILSSMVGEAA